MVPELYFYTDLLDLVAKGEVPMSRIDDAVSRILK
jgi:beta-glucosidase